MKDQDRTVWETEGLTTMEGGTLDRVFISDKWLAPSNIELNGDTLIWPRDATYKEVQPGKAMIEDFVSLHAASNSDLLKYARRWGVMEICSHGLPTSHSFPSWASNQESLKQICQPRQSAANQAFEEPLAIWRKFSLQARAILNIAANLHSGRRGEAKDWDVISSLYQGCTQEWTLSTNREEFSFLIQKWLGLGAVRPWFSWSGKFPSLQFGSAQAPTSGVFSALAMQLFLIVSRVEGLALCCSCGKPFVPERRPQAGRRMYCRRCRTKGAAIRDAMRDYRKSEGYQKKQKAKKHKARRRK